MFIVKLFFRRMVSAFINNFG